MSDDTFNVPERAEYRYLVQDEDEEEEQYVRRRYVSPLQVPSTRCILLISLTVAALLCLAVYLAYESKTLPAGMARVSTQCGDFRGRHVSPNTLTHVKASRHWLHWDSCGIACGAVAEKWRLLL